MFKQGDPLLRLLEADEGWGKIFAVSRRDLPQYERVTSIQVLSGSGHRPLDVVAQSRTRPRSTSASAAVLHDAASPIAPEHSQLSLTGFPLGEHLFTSLRHTPSLCLQVDLTDKKALGEQLKSKDVQGVTHIFHLAFSVCSRFTTSCNVHVQDNLVTLTKAQASTCRCEQYNNVSCCSRQQLKTCDGHLTVLVKLQHTAPCL